MIKKLFRGTIDFIKEEWIFLVTVISISIICCWPVDYYIIIGGGISDVGERIEVENGYSSKGSFNLSYVSELKGTTVSYLLSYVIPSWERLGIDYYQYDESDDFDTIDFRGDLELKNANSVAVKTAYELANKDIKVISNNIYVIAKFEGYESDLKIKDQILKIDGKALNSVKEYQQLIQTFDVGDEVVVTVLRNDKEVDVVNTIYDLEGRKILGISLNYYYELEVDPEVDINFESGESGPSGGLMTTLEIYNQLVKEDITKGYTIAGTGTIEEDGSIGSIGGVKYKVLGAADGGADIFLVPAGSNYESAIAAKEEMNLDIEIYAVSTIEEALDILNNL